VGYSLDVLDQRLARAADLTRVDSARGSMCNLSFDPDVRHLLETVTFATGLSSS
jgi:hypothetical protein